jgi:membrane protein implicated in regulation of membrane protease activity
MGASVMNGDHRELRVWLRGALMLALGVAIALVLVALTPWPWTFVIALAIAGLFLWMGRRGLLWVWRRKRQDDGGTLQELRVHGTIRPIVRDGKRVYALSR